MSVLTCVLYHDLVDQPGPFEADLGITTHTATFEKHLEHYARNYDFVTLSDVLGGTLPKKPLFLTFDDCYRSVYEIARISLKPRNIPALFFVNPDFIGNDTIPLDCVIVWAAQKVGVGDLSRLIGCPAPGSGDPNDLIRDELSKRNATEREEIRQKIITTLEISPEVTSDKSRTLTASELAELPKMGVEIGNHTASHVHCRSLTDNEIGTQIIDAKHQLEELSQSPVRSFSMPYGNQIDLTPRVEKAIMESGHEAIFLVHARSNRFRPSHHIWYRTSLQNQSVNALSMHLRIKPFLRSLKSMIH